MDTSVYSHALDIWSKADLTGLQKQLDENVLEVKEKEFSSLDSRKVLALETKKFKKLQTDEKVDQINNIIKQYQQEVDHLTKRAQFSESVLMSIYGKLAETPDPKPLLQNSIDKFGNLEDAKSLREHVDELQDKLAKYADYESLKSRLLDLEQNSAVLLTKRLASQEQELVSVWEEKHRNWNDKENVLMKQVESLKANNNALENKISRQVELDGSNDAQTEGQSNNDTQFTHVNISENNFLVQELESSQSRVFQLEKRTEELTSSLAKAISTAEKESQVLEKDMKINQLESENALLSASFQRERSTHKNAKSQLDEELNLSKAELESYKSELENFRRILNNYSDYNKLKDELSALKKIEFGVDDVSSDGEEPNVNGTSTDTKMENTLIAVNKKLQSNLAELRSKDIDQAEELSKLTNQITQLTSKVDELEKLNTKLEADLEKVEDIDQKFNDAASMISGATRQLNKRVGGGRLSPTSSIVGIPEESEFPSMVNTSSILPIVTKQRDRFRTRNMELEKQLKQFNTEKNKLKSEMSKLQIDNKKLQDRVRYVSSYKGSSNSTDFSHSDVDTEAQISKNIEESMNPLIDFKKRESEYNKSHRLPITERLFIKFSKIVSASRTSRMIFIMYSIGLHGLVLLLFMYFGNISDYIPAAEVSKVASARSMRNAADGGVKVNAAGGMNANANKVVDGIINGQNNAAGINVGRGMKA